MVKIILIKLAKTKINIKYKIQIITVPGILKTQFEQHLTNNDEIKFSLLLSIPQFPTIFFSFASGFIIDKIGYRIGGICFTMLISIALTLEITAAYLDNYDLMLTGLFIYYSSMESVVVT